MTASTIVRRRRRQSRRPIATIVYASIALVFLAMNLNVLFGLRPTK